MALVELLNVQAQAVQVAFQYCLASLMVETELVDTTPGKTGTLCTFRTMARDEFSLVRPPMTEAREMIIKKTLRTILAEESPI